MSGTPPYKSFDEFCQALDADRAQWAQQGQPKRTIRQRIRSRVIDIRYQLSRWIDPYT